MLLSEYMEERLRILHNKQSGIKPHTSDPILQTWSFCNVFREDDRTTVWFRENIRDEWSDYPYMALFSVAAFRWFNRIETGETLVAHNLIADWDPEVAEREIGKQDKITCSAYRTKTKPLGKLKGTVSTIDDFYEDLGEHTNNLLDIKYLQDQYHYLMGIPWLGEFSAYQFLTDLVFTDISNHCRDKNIWAAAGPGAQRGLNRIHNRDLGYQQNQTQWLLEIREVEKQVKLELPWDFPFLRTMDIQHNLCEYDKYHRVLEGGRMKRKYKS